MNDQKELRKQLRRVVKEVLPEVVAAEVAAEIEKKVFETFGAKLDELNKRYQDLFLYIVRNSGINASGAKDTSIK